MNILLVLVPQLASRLVTWADKAPEDKDVKAGWGAFFIFLGLAAAVALLGWSLVRQLKRAKANADAGVFGPEDMESPTDPTAPTSADLRPPSAPAVESSGDDGPPNAH